MIWSLLTTFTGCSDRSSESAASIRSELARLNEPAPVLRSQQSATPVEIQAFCGDCHALPNPESFVREIWYDEIRKGFEFYARSGRSDLVPPAPESVLKFYRERAPTVLAFPKPPEIAHDWRSRFDREPVDWSSGSNRRVTPAVSSIRWTKLEPEGIRRLVVTDMREGSVRLVTPEPQRSSSQLLARTGTPARATPCDFNGDGRTDFMVSDLGSFNPYDHTFGRVVWLKQGADSGEFQAITIAEKLGRVADVSVADYSADGELDLVVAEFGHRETGGVRLLTNVSADADAAETEAADRERAGDELRFSQQMIDVRPGATQVLAHDWNEDGAMDFAALISQEFECVELFINGGTKFDSHRAATGTDLTFGSVGMELADLDQDGDQDILYVNGDCFDNNFANRSHGIQWLENTGNLAFRSHRLLDLPGAYRAVSADIDADEDMDIVAVANLPTTVYPADLSENNPASIVLLEQVAPLKFEVRVLERGTPRYPALEVADFNRDGKVDFAVGAQLFETDPAGSPAASLPRLMIWWQK